MGKGKAALFARRSSGSMLVRMVGMGLAFLVQIVFARALKVDEYGVYIYVLTWLNVLLLLGIWGWGSSSIKFVSIYSSKKNWPALKGFLLTTFLLPTLTSLLLALLVILFMNLFNERVGEYLAEVFIIGMLLLPFNALLTTAGSGMQGFKYVVRAQMPQAVYRPLLLVGLILLFVMQLGYTGTARHAMILNLVAAIAVTVFAWSQLRWSLPFSPAEHRASYSLGEWSKVAFPLLMVSGFALLMKQFDIIMLGILRNTSEAGIYSVSARIAELTSFGLTTINLIVAPMVAELFAANKKDELQKTAAHAALGILLFTAPIALVLLVFGNYILLMFGQGFDEGYWSLVILVVAQFLNASVGSVGFFMTMTGHQNDAAKIMAFGAVLNVVLNLFFIPAYGMLGAAVATATSLMCWNLIMLSQVKKRIGIDTTIFSIYKVIK